jgi:hypothetical protein
MPSSMDVFSKGKNDFFPANIVPYPDLSPKKSHGSGTLQLTWFFYLQSVSRWRFCLNGWWENSISRSSQLIDLLLSRQPWGDGPCFIFSLSMSICISPLHMFTPVLRVRSSKKRTVCMQCFRKPYWCSYIRCRYSPVFRIHMFLFLPDPDPPVRGMDPDPSIRNHPKLWWIRNTDLNIS